MAYGSRRGKGSEEVIQKQKMGSESSSKAAGTAAYMLTWYRCGEEVRGRLCIDGRKEGGSYPHWGSEGLGAFDLAAGPHG